MFKFNFSTGNENGDDIEKLNIETSTMPCKECQEIVPSPEQIEKFASTGGQFMNEMQFDGKQSVIFFPVEDLVNELTEESADIKYSEQNRSDIIPGVYEGGAKVWECTQDLGLILTMSDDDESKSIISGFRDKAVLDLGCGGGILGILALNAGAVVHFQDYNESIIKHITIPNAIVNIDTPETTLLARTKFFSGDWNEYVDRTAADGLKFDYILTSETIYNPQSYRKLLNLFKAKLQSDGIIYLAAKSVYFGVGGSVAQFIDAIDKDAAFAAKIIHSIKDNVHRDILEIKFK